jgi:hypothetical protein
MKALVALVSMLYDDKSDKYDMFFYINRLQHVIKIILYTDWPERHENKEISMIMNKRLIFLIK